jgi:multicomponent K+:H+ antiporter subunit E
MIGHIIPHPRLSSMLFVLWLLLVNHITMGSLVMAALLAIIIPLLTAAYWPGCPLVGDMPAFGAYVLLVLYDVITANIEVVRIVLFKPTKDIQSAWICVPLDIKTPEAIALLAGTITMTPGTLTADMAPDGRALLVHALHAPDPQAVCDEIKARYEARLKRIFE